MVVDQVDVSISGARLTPRHEVFPLALHGKVTLLIARREQSQANSLGIRRPYPEFAEIPIERGAKHSRAFKSFAGNGLAHVS